jgi:hypothetical protein
MIAIMQLPDRFSDIEPLTRVLQTFASECKGPNSASRDLAAARVENLLS